MEDWLKVSDLEARTGLSNSTVRRYIQRYLEYLPHNEIKGEYFFTPQAVEILQHISRLTGERKPPELIREELQQEYGPPVVEVMPNNLQQVSKELAVTADVFAKLVELLDQKQEISELRMTINRLEDSVERRLQERDARLLEVVRKLQEERTKTWWEKLIGR